MEGGIWRDPGFEARIDCIWHAGEPPNDLATLRLSNAKAAQFIADRSAVHDVFVLTASGVRMR